MDGKTQEVVMQVSVENLMEALDGVPNRGVVALWLARGGSPGAMAAAEEAARVEYRRVLRRALGLAAPFGEPILVRWTKDAIWRAAGHSPAAPGSENACEWDEESTDEASLALA